MKSNITKMHGQQRKNILIRIWKDKALNIGTDTDMTCLSWSLERYDCGEFKTNAQGIYLEISYCGCSQKSLIRISGNPAEISKVYSPKISIKI